MMIMYEWGNDVSNKELQDHSTFLQNLSLTTQDSILRIVFSILILQLLMRDSKQKLPFSRN